MNKHLQVFTGLDSRCSREPLEPFRFGNLGTLLVGTFAPLLLGSGNAWKPLQHCSCELPDLAPGNVGKFATGILRNLALEPLPAGNLCKASVAQPILKTATPLLLGTFAAASAWGLTRMFDRLKVQVDHSHLSQCGHCLEDLPLNLGDGLAGELHQEHSWGRAPQLHHAEASLLSWAFQHGRGEKSL